MVKVIAATRGYFGGILRELGDDFHVPDDVWEDEKRRPKWVKLDPGSSEPEAETDEPDGDDKGGKGKAKGKGGKKAKTVDAPNAAPFADNGDPEPVRVKNEVNDATGGTAPDWIAPGTPHTPVMADE